MENLQALGWELNTYDLIKPSYWEMLEIHGILRESGLESVICQTEHGKTGASGGLLFLGAYAKKLSKILARISLENGALLMYLYCSACICRGQFMPLSSSFINELSFKIGIIGTPW